MGHKVGWLTLNAGMAGGADIILIPEIPYDLDKIAAKIQQRHDRGSRFTILAVAEGAISKEDAKLSKKEYRKKLSNYKYPSVSYEIAEKLAEKCGFDVRVTVPGHTQRGGSPCPYDRVFASRLGSEAAKLILNGEYGFMIGYKNREMVKVPLEDVAGKLKMVDPNSSWYRKPKCSASALAIDLSSSLPSAARSACANLVISRSQRPQDVPASCGHLLY